MQPCSPRAANAMAPRPCSGLVLPRQASGRFPGPIRVETLNTEQKKYLSWETGT